MRSFNVSKSAHCWTLESLLTGPMKSHMGEAGHFDKRQSQNISLAKWKLIRQSATEIAKNIFSKKETK